MTEALHMYICSNQIMLRRQTGFLWKKKTETVNEWNWDSRQGLDFSPLKPSAKRATLSVYLGAALCKLMCIDIPDAIKNDKDKLALARAQMQHHLGINPEEWNFEFDTSLPGKAIVCAVRKLLFEQIREMAAQKHCKLISLTPYFSNIWNCINRSENKPRYGLMIVESDVFTTLLATENRIDSATTLHHYGETHIIEREAERLRLSMSLETEHPLHIACSRQLTISAPLHNGALLENNTHLKQDIYPDFRDLVFSNSPEIQPT